MGLSRPGDQNDGSLAQLIVDEWGQGSVFKALTMGTNTTSDLLYVTDLNNANVAVFDANFAPTTVPGGFVDPNMLSNFSSFAITNTNGDLYISHAMPEDSARTDVVRGR